MRISINDTTIMNLSRTLLSDQFTTKQLSSVLKAHCGVEVGLSRLNMILAANHYGNPMKSSTENRFWSRAMKPQRG